uniref:Ig-like domain-containing protein n=1 Tax=Cyclopterus lumpus TaxID=8103 RepID=A0A8C3G8N1_CYCLU
LYHCCYKIVFVQSAVTHSVLPGQPVNSSCLVQMNPPSVVVRFGDSFSVNCSSTSDLIESMGLESRYGSSMSSSGNSFVVLKVESVTDWEFEPICFLNHLRDGQCLQTLPVTVYKTPDTVSISPPSLEGLVEGERYSIQCDIVNVAPVSSLSVHWHRGDAIFYTERFDGSSLSPVNKTSVFNLTAQRGDDETRIWCEAQLDFWTPAPMSAQRLTARAPTPNISPSPKLQVRYCYKSSSCAPPLLSCRVDYSITPPFYCFPSGSHAGTTAGILMAVFFVLIVILGCVVYHKQKHPEQMS